MGSGVASTMQGSIVATAMGYDHMATAMESNGMTSGVECHMGLSQQDARVTKSGGLAIIRKYMPSRCDNKILT